MRRRSDTDLETKLTNGSTPSTPGASATATPTVPTAPPVPSRLPRPPAPPSSTVDPAAPGRRDEAPSDLAVTTRLARITVEPTPAPLPPSPAAADADRWFEQVPTSPGNPRRDSNGTGPAPRMVVGEILPPSAAAAPVRPWFLPALMVATALAVGMVLGALLFGHRGARCAPCAPGVP